MKLILIISLFLCLANASDNYKQAKLFYNQRQYPEAIQQFKRIGRQSELKPYANYYALKSSFLIGDIRQINPSDFNVGDKNQPFLTEIKTMKMAFEFLDGRPLDDEQLLKCSQYFLMIGNYHYADFFAEALIDKNQDQYNLIKAEIFFSQSDKVNARIFLERVSHSPQKLLKMKTYFGEKNYKKLIMDFPNDPSSWEATYFLFKQARSQGNFAEAISYLNFLEEKAGGFYRNLACFEKGYIYYRLGKYHEALSNLQKVELGAQQPAALFWIAKTHQKLNNPTAKEQVLKKIIQDYPFSYYSYRASSITGILPKIPDKKFLEQEKLPKRLSALLKAQAYDDVFYELNTFYQDQRQLWESVAVRLFEQQQYFYVIKLNKVLKDYYWQYPLAYVDVISRQSQVYLPDKYLVLALMREESHFKEDALSSSKAVGLMQLMPATAKEVADKLKIKQYDLLLPEDNIKLGTFYLDYLIKRFGLIKAVMAYNCGPGNLTRNDTSEPIDEFIENFPLSETRRYIKKVMSSYWTYQLLYNNI